MSLHSTQPSGDFTTCAGFYSATETPPPADGTLYPVCRAGAGQPQGRGAQTRGSGCGAEAGRADAVPETFPGLASARGDTPEAPRLSSEAPAFRPPARQSQRPEPPAERPARRGQHWARAALRAIGASRGHALWKLAPPQTRPSPRGAATPFPPALPARPGPQGTETLLPLVLPARLAPSSPGLRFRPNSRHASRPPTPALRRRDPASAAFLARPASSGPGLRTPISAHAPGTSRALRPRPPH